MSAFTRAGGWYEPVGDRDLLFRVTRPLPWEVGREGSGLWVVVPPGYLFDVSVPRWVRWLFAPDDERYLKAAALHDWSLDDGWNRIGAAGLFGSALKAEGVPLWRRLVMVIAVIVWNFD